MGAVTAVVVEPVIPRLCRLPDQVGAALDRGEIGDDLEHRHLVGSGLADAGTPAGHGVADHLVAVAAVKPIDDGRQDGFIERKSR